MKKKGACNMEKRPLTEEELTALEKQYWELTQTLEGYRQEMRRRNYRKIYSESVRERADQQFAFFKSALNETVLTLIDQQALSVNTAMDALWNRYMKLSTRFKLSGYILLGKAKHE